MSLADDLYEMPTLLSIAQGKGLDTFELYSCPSCGRQVPPEGLVSSKNLPGEQPAFICHTCASGPFREARAAAEAEAKATGPVDWTDTRAERSLKLTLCDWTQVADVDLTAEQKQAWTEYRQKLRNITTDFPNPDSVVWPNPPA